MNICKLTFFVTFLGKVQIRGFQKEAILFFNITMAAYSENFSGIIPYKSINASSICAKALNIYIYTFPAKYY